MPKVVFLYHSFTSLIRVFVSPNFLPDRLASFYSSQGCLHVSNHLARPSLSHHLHEMPDLSNKPVEMDGIFSRTGLQLNARMTHTKQT
jgi:hypothetical protein